jgi:hypothetical protein
LEREIKYDQLRRLHKDGSIDFNVFLKDICKLFGDFLPKKKYVEELNDTFPSDATEDLTFDITIESPPNQPQA